MAKGADAQEKTITRKELARLLNDDLAREYQAIIAYLFAIWKALNNMAIADQLKTHAAEELKHVLTISRQIDYLGWFPVTPKAVQVCSDPHEMLSLDLDNENETIRNYRERVRQCKALGEFALAEQIHRSSSMNRTTKLT